MTATLSPMSVQRGGEPRPMEPFEIHRRGWLIGLAVVAPIAVACAYGWAAYAERDWVLAAIGGAFLLLGLSFAPALRDLRSPLLVADEHGVRLQGAEGWVGLLWSEIRTISVSPTRTLSSGPSLRLSADHLAEPYRVPLGLATDRSAGNAEIELARRRDIGRR